MQKWIDDYDLHQPKFAAGSGAAQIAGLLLFAALALPLIYTVWRYL